MSYRIVGKHRDLFPEEIDTAETLENAEYLLNEYRLAFGVGWELWVEAVSINNDDSIYNSNPFCQCNSKRYNPKVISKFEESGRSKPTKCRICEVATREGKDLCTDHIDQADYVKELTAKMARMKAEDEKAAKGKVVFLDNETIKELLQTLKLHGPLSMERLARDLNRDKKIIEGYVKALKKKRQVKTKRIGRGVVMVLLPTQ